MADFDKCIEFVLRLEDSTLAGKVVNLGDGGGFTRFGLTLKSHPELDNEGFYDESSTPVVAALEMAKATYRDAEWARIQGDAIFSNLVAATLLSFAVNDGVVQAVREIQGCRQIGIPPTGFFGPRTLAAVNAVIPPEDLAFDLRAAQIAFYEEIVKEHPDKARFLAGWKNRANAVFVE